MSMKCGNAGCEGNITANFGDNGLAIRPAKVDEVEGLTETRLVGKHVGVEAETPTKRNLKTLKQQQDVSASLLKPCSQ